MIHLYQDLTQYDLPLPHSTKLICLYPPPVIFFHCLSYFFYLNLFSYLYVNTMAIFIIDQLCNHLFLFHLLSSLHFKTFFFEAILLLIFNTVIQLRILLLIFTGLSQICLSFSSSTMLQLCSEFFHFLHDYSQVYWPTHSSFNPLTLPFLIYHSAYWSHNTAQVPHNTLCLFILLRMNWSIEFVFF